MEVEKTDNSASYSSREITSGYQLDRARRPDADHDMLGDERNQYGGEEET